MYLGRSNDWTQDEGYNNALLDETTAQWDDELNKIYQKQMNNVWCQPTPDIDSNLNYDFMPNDLTGFNIDNNHSINNPDAQQMLGGFHNTQPNTLTVNDFMNTQQQQQQVAPLYYNPQQAFSHMQLPQTGALQYPGPPVYKPVNNKNCKIEPPIDSSSLIHYSEMSK